MSIPAPANMPPSAPKSFCISTTITAVHAGSMLIGSGFACTVTAALIDIATFEVRLEGCRSPLLLLRHAGKKPRRPPGLRGLLEREGELDQHRLAERAAHEVDV